jgi:hypothetical protein
MRTALLVVNAGDYLHHEHRRSLTAAALRWGADYVELRAAADPVHCAARQLFLADPVPWERVCWIDADVLVRRDAPSVFGVAADPSRVWGVPDADSCPLAPDDRAAVVARHLREYGSIEDRVGGGVNAAAFRDAFVNCGLVVLTPAVHRPALVLFRQLLESASPVERASAHYEQALFNYCLHLARLPVAHLPMAWNRLSPPPGGEVTTDYVWHFTGLDGAEQKRRVGKVNW